MTTAPWPIGDRRHAAVLLAFNAYFAWSFTDNERPREAVQHQ